MPFLCLVALYVGITSLIAAETLEEVKVAAAPRAVATSLQAEAQAYIDASFALLSDEDAKAKLHMVAHTIMSSALGKAPPAHPDIFCKHVCVVAKMYESPSPCAMACLALLYVKGNAVLLVGTTLEKTNDLTELVSTLFDEKSIETAHFLIGLAERKINPGFA